MDILKLLKKTIECVKNENVSISISHPSFKRLGKTQVVLYLEVEDGIDLAEMIAQERKIVMLEQKQQQEQEYLSELQSRVVKPSKQKSCFTYLMLDTRNGLHKIGKSKHPQYREKTLQSEVPQIKIIAYCADWIVSESDLHRCYQSKRVRGEWFNLTKQDISTIKNLMQA